MPTAATLTVIGLGPGDPDLITVKGSRALQAADVVFVPAPTLDESGRALAIAQPWLDLPRQQVLTLPMPMRPNLVPAHYAALAATIVQHLRPTPPTATPRCGAYLLLGDPLLYGTFGAVWEQLCIHDPNLRVAIIPGITSFAAVAAQTGILLAHKDDRLAVVPALYALDLDSTRQLFQSFATVVFLKVGRVLPDLIRILDQLDLTAHALYAEHIGMPEARVVRDLSSLREYSAPYLSLVLVRQPQRRST